MAEQPRQLPVNEQEIALLQSNFKGNEDILKLVRSHFFGFKLSDAEKLQLKGIFKNTDVLNAVRKKIYPILSNDVPIGQVADFWMGSEQNVYGQSKDTIYQTLHSKQLVLEMLEKALKLLTEDGEIDSLDYNPKLLLTDELGIQLLARNLYIKTVETGLNFIKLTADMEITSPTEIKKNAVKNSSK